MFIIIIIVIIHMTLIFSLKAHWNIRVAATMSPWSLTFPKALWVMKSCGWDTRGEGPQVTRPRPNLSSWGFVSEALALPQSVC